MRTFAQKKPTSQTKSASFATSNRPRRVQSYEAQFTSHLRAIGNQAAQRLLLTKGEELADNSLTYTHMQPKLEVTAPGDKYEQEANRMAGTVMQMSTPAVALDSESVPTVRRMGTTSASDRETCIGRMGKEKEQEHLQAQEGPGQKPTITLETSPHLQDLHDKGRPLTPFTQAFFEPRFGYDFGQVRVHTDERAAASARAVNALAYTVGRDIVFGARQYQPTSDSGMRLLAHELTHVLQQTQSPALDRQAVLPTAQSASHSGTGRPLNVATLASPVTASQTILARKESSEETPEEETEVAFGSPDWPLWELEPILTKLPFRWIKAIQRYFGKRRFADPQLDRQLVYNQITALTNLIYADIYTATSLYKPEFSQALSAAEALSGVDTYLNLISLALQYDLEKYLKTDLPDVVKANLGWAIIYGLLIQGGLVGVNAAMEEDLDLTSFLKLVLSPFTETPEIWSRLYHLENILDPRWSSFPHLTSPGGLESKLSGVFKEADPYNFALKLGVDIASIMSMADLDLPEDFELFPYLNVDYSWPKEGQEPPPTTGHWLAGTLFGGIGEYGLLEVGQKLATSTTPPETYLRAGLILRELGPLSLFQLTEEYSFRPNDIKSRLNVATKLNLLDDSVWQLMVGGTLGGLLPTEKSPGSLDVGGGVSLFHQYRRPESPEPFKTGFDVSAMYRTQDPFDPASARLFSFKGTFSLLDFVKFAIEYHRITGESLDLDLPTKDVRFMIFFGPGIVNF